MEPKIDVYKPIILHVIFPYLLRKTSDLRPKYFPYFIRGLIKTY
jgi:hypothetical protein